MTDERNSIPTFADLKRFDRERLMEFYDHAANQRDSARAGFYLDELRRRDARRRELVMVALTVAILILTAVNVVVVVRR